MTASTTDEWEFGGIRTSEFSASLESSDMLGQVLKGHLAIESVLGTALTTILAQKAFEKMRLSFVKKVQLSVALGLVGENDEPGFMLLNSIRNSLAHNYHYTVSDDDGVRLVKSLSEGWQKAPPVMALFESGTLKNHLICGICVLYVIAGRAVESAMREIEARERLAKILGEIKERGSLHKLNVRD